MSLSKSYVLVLNSNWWPIGVKSLKDAITSIFKFDNWQIIRVDEVDGQPLIETMTWNDWVHLTVTDKHDHIKTVRGLIRKPTVILAKNHSRVIYKKPKPSRYGIYNRDKGICQYTGKRLNKNDFSIDHLIPRSRGGTNTWENMVLCDKVVNNKKGSKLPTEFGIKVMKQPKAPDIIPISSNLSYKHRDWKYFIN